MPIEFRCTKCDRLLRTPDGTAGKEARCPQCGAVMPIPEVAVASYVAPAAQPAPREAVPPGMRDTLPHGAAANPYASPESAEMRAPPSEIRRAFTPTQVDFGEVWSKTWRIYSANIWLCVIVALPMVIMGSGQNAYVYARWGHLQPSENMIGIAVLVVRLWLMLGVMSMMLKVARGEPIDVADLFSAGPVLLPAIGVTVLAGVLVSLGFCLLVVPGIILSLTFALALWIVLDQRAGVLDALRMSREATSGNKLTLLALWLVAFSAGIAVIVCTCGLGVIFVQPFWLLLWCVVYLSMTGQTTIGDEVVTP